MGELLPNKDNLVAYLAASGGTAAEIAEQLQTTPAAIKKTLSLEHVQVEIEHLRYKLFGKDVQKRFKDMLPAAQDAVEDILSNPNSTKPQLRFNAAQEIFDRALGKPKQSVEHTGSLIRELFDRLGNESIPLDITPVRVLEEPLAAEKPRSKTKLLKEKASESADPIDAWAKENA